MEGLKEFMAEWLGFSTSPLVDLLVVTYSISFIFNFMARSDLQTDFFNLVLCPELETQKNTGIPTWTFNDYPKFYLSKMNSFIKTVFSSLIFIFLLSLFTSNLQFPLVSQDDDDDDDLP